MKPMKKRTVLPALFDMRGKLLVVGQTALVRKPFPQTASILFGEVADLRIAKDGELEAKIKGYKQWFRNPLKLAEK